MESWFSANPYTQPYCGSYTNVIHWDGGSQTEDLGTTANIGVELGGSPTVNGAGDGITVTATDEIKVVAPLLGLGYFTMFRAYSFEAYFLELLVSLHLKSSKELHVFGWKICLHESFLI